MFKMATFKTTLHQKKKREQIVTCLMSKHKHSSHATHLAISTGTHKILWSYTSHIFNVSNKCHVLQQVTWPPKIKSQWFIFLLNKRGKLLGMFITWRSQAVGEASSVWEALESSWVFFGNQRLSVICFDTQRKMKQAT